MQTSTAQRPNIAGAILIIGCLGYLLLCLPAIGRRGYPPIDPVWLGVVHLWVVPVCLSGLFDSFSFRGRRRQLVAYALVTAFIDSGTAHTTTPRYIHPAGMLVMTVIWYGPIHLLGTFAVEALTQFLLRRRQPPVDSPGEARGVPRISLWACIIGFTALCVGIGFPFAYRSLSISFERARGVSLADKQWAAGNAVVFQDLDLIRVGDLQVEYHVDPKTGLPRQHRMLDTAFQDAYDARIAELIKTHGEPEWSLKRHLPSPDELAALLDATDLVEITSFPHELTPGIVLIRGGTLTRGNTTYSSGSNSLSIVTERSGMIGAGGVQPVYVRLNDPLVVVRNGSQWVAVFHEDGKMIASAWRP